MPYCSIFRLSVCVSLLLGLAATAIAQDFKVTLDPTRRVAFKTADGHRVMGELQQYRRDGFVVATEADGPRDLTWDQLDPANAERIWKRALRSDDALGWAHAAVVYQDLEDRLGLTDARVRRSAMAFDTALRLDPTLADAVAAWRGGGAEEGPVDDHDHGSAEHAEQDPAQAHGQDHDHAATAAAPRPRGAEFWRQLSPEQHDQRTADAVALTRRNLDAVGIRYTQTETEHFVLFADDSLGRRDRQFTLGLLEEMYADCLFMFALDEQDQVYAGKCTVVVIRQAQDFFAYEKQAYNRVTNALGGVCHYLPNGDVQIVAHRGDDEWFFRKMLVHENVHGFVHRYRSQGRVPLWINEGLAEYIAHRVVPQSTVVEARRREAHSELRKDNDLTGVFYSWPSTQWAYGISYGLTEFMIDGDRLAYRQLIHDVKDGVPWLESLQKNFRVDPAGLLELYCNAHGLPAPGS